MKKLAILFAGLFIMAISVQNVSAQTPTDDATATASAYIVSPIAIVKTTDMNFGNIIAPTAAGNVVLDFSNGVTSGNVTFPTGNLGTRTSARFNVTGQANLAFSIDFPATIDLSNGTEDMTLTLSSQAGTSSTLDGSGTKELIFGGSLAVNAGQEDGLYENDEDFVVTVAYE